MSNAKKLLAIFLACTMLLCAAPMAGFVGLEIFDFDCNLSADAAEIVKSGTCGTNVTYTLDSEGLLTISGTGAMWNSSSPPWYSNRSAIKTVIIKNGVTSIGDYAFFYCIWLTSVTIGNSVTSIGDYAFRGCSSLSSVTIPDSVTSIGSYAFYNCTKLTSVIIPDSVTSIGGRAFSNCTSLTAITVNSDNTTYCSEDGVLFNKNKTELIQYLVGNERTGYSIPDSVTSIGDDAFYNCDSLTLVTIPDSVTSIGEYAFEDCDSLTSVIIPDSVTSIGDGAFYNCDSLGEIVIENKDCQIYDSSDTIPANAVIRGHDDSTAQSYAEKYNRGFVSIDGAGSDIILSGYCGDNADFTLTRGGTLHITGTGAVYSYKSSTARPWYKYRGFIRTVIIDDGITEIGNFAFSQFYNLLSVTIPNSVTSIGWSAFEYCTKLTSVTIGDSVTSIGWSAFEYCTSLASVTIPDSVTSIEYSAFNGCTSLTTVTIGNSVTCIGDSAFKGCTSLTSVTIPDSVTSIGKWVFEDCTSLTSVTIPDSVTSIGDSAFYNCTSLTSVTIPDSVTSIGAWTFSDCTSLTSVTIGDSVTSIGDSAFRYCTSLTSVTIPGSVTSIGDSAFYNCTKLTSVTIFNPNCKIYDSADTISATAVIRAYDGSTANAYARKYNRTFELIAECTHEKTETIPAVAATCTKGGFTTGTRCAVCRTVLVAPVATPAAHNYTSRITTPATHTTEGVKTFTCSACSDTYTEPVAKLEGHTYTSVVTAPTCTAQGYTTYTCECGDVYIADYIPSLGGHVDADGDGACDRCEPVRMPGDADGDGTLTSSDARLALRAAVSLDSLSEAQLAAADADKDGKVTSSDARLILRAAVGLETL